MFKHFNTLNRTMIKHFNTLNKSVIYLVTTPSYYKLYNINRNHENLNIDNKQQITKHIYKSTRHSA